MKPLQQPYILKLPNELLLLTVRNLTITDLLAVFSTSRQFRTLMTPAVLAYVERTKKGMSTLQWAAYRGHIGLAKLLLENNTGNKSTGNDLDTPFVLAVEFGSVDLVRLFLDHGADIEQLSFDGYTPLQTAVARFVFMQEAIHSVLDQYSLVERRRVGEILEVIRLLIKYGASTSSPSSDGYTALELVSQLRTVRGVAEVMEILLIGGAKLDSRTRDGDTPLHLAVRAGIAKNVEALVKWGADVSARNGDSKTPQELVGVLGDERLLHVLTKNRPSKKV